MYLYSLWETNMTRIHNHGGQRGTGVASLGAAIKVLSVLRFFRKILC